MKNKKANQKPKVKIFCESLSMNPGINYFTGAVKIKFPDRTELVRRGCFPYAETIKHNGREYLIRYVDQLQKLPKLLKGTAI